MTPKRWRRIEELYHSARERDPERRGAFLAEACKDDEELRRIIELLLAQDSSGDKILDHPAADLLENPTKTKLIPGTELGPYRIEGTLGTGGMGEVYRARDPRMGRDVAVKVSNERFSDRFSREVHAVAALNHPNICHLYDVGPDYLVMELVEGPTLAERIKQGPVPLEEALAIARQMAEALEAAHDKGIVHRDLKPGNIKLTAAGAVKVLDFGLAKTLEPATGSPEDSPTMTATQEGMILGTAAYMSPEQALGKPVDKRADIWAFGLVLWELLTGHRLFEGDSVMHILAGVLNSRIAFEQLPRETQRLFEDCCGAAWIATRRTACETLVKRGSPSTPHFSRSNRRRCLPNIDLYSPGSPRRWYWLSRLEHWRSSISARRHPSVSASSFRSTRKAADKPASSYPRMADFSGTPQSRSLPGSEPGTDRSPASIHDW